MIPDIVDVLLEQWVRERPDLDAAAMAVVSRLLMLYKHLEQGADRALIGLGLTLWQLDVLAVLRRSGPPFALSPTQLMQAVTLSSGAMTNRIDRLENAGWVERLPDPADRRGVLIQLTAAGKELVDRAMPVRFDQARDITQALTPEEFDALANLLRKLLVRHQPAPVAGAAGNGRRGAAS